MLHKYRNLVISPHIDDAFLALGGMLAKEANYKQRILDIFTITDFAPRANCTRGDVECITRLRKEEELLNCGSVGAEVTFLDFQDSPLRLREADEGSAFDAEKRTSEAVNDKVRTYLAESERVFFPLAVGRHIDHVLICKIGLELVSEGGEHNNIYFYEDQPYSARKHRAYSLIDPSIKGMKLKSSLVPISFSKKWKLCTTYESQFSKRVYRAILVYAKRVRLLGTFNERIWQIADPSYAKEILAEKAKKYTEKRIRVSLNQLQRPR